MKKTTIGIAIALVLGIIGVSIFWYYSGKNQIFGTQEQNQASSTIVGNEVNKNLPPEAAISACTGKAINDACQFNDNGSTATGVCDDKPGVLACKKNDAPGSGQAASSSQTNNQKPSGGQSTYGIEQAISDQAQLNTLAFDGLGFLTGNTCSDSFLPPGKVADFFGFQYLRDLTANGKGHDTDFVTNSANNVLYTLNASQKAKMTALAKSQSSAVNEFAYKRFPLMVAFRRQFTGDVPTGTTGLSKSAVMEYSADLYEIDAQISLQRARLFGEIIKSFTADQKKYFDGMVKGGFASWTVLPDQVDKVNLTREQSVLMMTYASEMFGWYAGNVEADTYFCPERQADYFGGFYIKDAPAIGNAGYTIDESITGDQGQAFIAALNSSQKSVITGLVATQKTALNGIVEKRRAISTELRNSLSSGIIDESKVVSLAREYGKLDGEISYYYATAFAKVGKTLTTEQKANLLKLRSLEGYACPSTSAYLYSEKISMPSVVNTDFLFQ
ncbi:MAG: hypothetical protein WCO21_03485 [bacterium]